MPEQTTPPAAIFRERIVESLTKLVARRRKLADADRKEVWNALLKSGPRFSVRQRQLRQEIRALLGWPLTDPPARSPSRRRLTPLDLVPWASTSRLEFEVIEGFRSEALVCCPAKPTGQTPRLLIIQHGGQGTPELVAGVPQSFNYNDAAQTAVADGWTVVLPQLPLWQANAEPAIDQSRIDLDLKQLGGSRAALDVLTLTRAADEALAEYGIPPSRLAIAGLSYGGFYALLTAALDPRFQAVFSSCYVNDRYVHNWTDWVWSGSASRIDDALLTQLICPRPLFVEVGQSDELFLVGSARPVLKKIRQGYSARKAGAQLVCREFAGGHEFAPDGEGIHFLTRRIEERRKLCDRR